MGISKQDGKRLAVVVAVVVALVAIGWACRDQVWAPAILVGLVLPRYLQPWTATFHHHTADRTFLYSAAVTVQLHMA